MTAVCLKINAADNVAVAIVPLHAGDTVCVGTDNVRLLTDVPAGHKVALKDFSEGEDVIKYG